MPDYPPAALRAAADAIERELLSGTDYVMAQDSDEALARATLDAAMPFLGEPYEDLLGDIHLYVNWRFVTRQLTTPQKEMWADAVEAWSARLNAGTGETTTVDRWWRDG
jgi:hypothetical protein